MGLTSALNTSLNGLSLNEVTIDVLGNNIANAGTNGFKASTVRFQTQLARTLSIGSRPTATDGGSNPRQVGLGATTSAISKDFTQGSLSNSTSASDLAIQGEGFFVMDGSGGRTYTRNGNFLRSSDSYLVNDQGQFVQGYGIDDEFNIVTTQLSPLRIPLGELNVAQRTSQITMGGALFPAGDLSTQGAIVNSEVLTDSVTGLPATGTALLSNVENAGGTNYFNVGETLTFAPRKGGRVVEEQSFTVTATSTLADYVNFMNNTLGIQSGAGIPNDATTGGQPGVTLTGGQIQVVGNTGSQNDISITAGDLKTNGAVVPLSFTKSESSNGESAATEFIVYDSLGQTVNVRMTSVLESRGPGATTFRYFLESADDSRPGVAIGTGLITFDSDGKITGDTTQMFTLERSDTAAVSPMQIEMDLSQISGISSAQSGSALNLANQNGSKPGTLQSYVIDEQGLINGIFDNGLIRPLGQVVLARFANSDGLLEAGGTAFREGVSSGVPQIVTPGSFGAGTIASGKIELSNTDIGRNLVDLIVASTNYRGNARVISSVQDLTNELLLLGR
ncbi:flagellar hook protein FlgE [Planctopirus hydrillae]|uniref:Flagellar hook protein FlgE n=1 Tax=Planctopirus hydrillae TaxID=1841610 RepID=A0A1C3EUH6_9PLAN|nr:flagellar hook-basal body complex protein [Planctopirus hydrillae]ODA36836.1 flagellar biosynthesis protein FlgE [Planctopirus hydrillae]